MSRVGEASREGFDEERTEELIRKLVGMSVEGAEGLEDGDGELVARVELVRAPAHHNAHVVLALELLAHDDLVNELLPSRFHHLVQVLPRLGKRILLERT